MELCCLIKPITSFKHENVLYIQGFLTILIFLWCYGQSKLTKNNSYIDIFRGIIPIIYCAFANFHYYYHFHAWNARLLLILFLITLWGIRMIYYVHKKLFKRGKFQSDFRLSVVRTFIYHPQRPYIWELFILFVVHLFQIICWFLMINCPLYMIYFASSNISLRFTDFILSALFLLFFIFECLSDYQMIEFRNKKFNKMLGGEYLRYNKDEIIIEKDTTFYGWKYDFCMTGLRKLCLHPSYFGEISLWFVFYLFGVINSELSIFSWLSIFGFIGFLGLCFKLYKIAKITEGILSYSYGSYYRYHATCNRFIPSVPKPMVVDNSVCDDNEIEEEYLPKQLLIRLRRMDKYRIFGFKYDKKLTKSEKNS